MNKYYFITGDFSKVGVPSFLEGGLYDTFIEKDKYITDHVFPPVNMRENSKWTKIVEKGDVIEMPEKLFLINKHRKLNFDVYPKNYGFIVSKEFKNLIDSLNHPKYISSPVEVLTREGVCNTNKEYFFIKILEQSPCINLEKSQLKVYKKTEKEQQPRIDKYLGKLYLNSDLFLPKDLFFIENRYLNEFLFCNQESCEILKKSKIKTIEILEIETLFSYLSMRRQGLKVIVE